MSPAVRKAATMSIISAGILIPPAFFYYMVVKFSPNIPYNDDYDVILGFLLQYLDAGGISERLSFIFAQHNEHRVAFVKALVLIQYYSSGLIDLRVVVFLGNLGLVGLLYVFYRLYGRDENRLLYLVPTTLLLFQFQYAETTLWPMAAVSNFYVLLFAFGALLLLRGQGLGGVFAAFLLAALASVTQGSGILAFIAGAFLLALKKDYRGLAVWSILSAAAFSLYFGLYVKPPHHPSVTRALFEEPGNTLHYFITFIGSSFPLSGPGHLLAGIFFISLFLFLTWRGYFRRNAAVYCCHVFVFMIAAVTALTRSGFGIEQALSSRYKIISVLFPILSLMAMFELVEGKKIERFLFPLVLAGSIAFNVVANATYSQYFHTHNKELRDGLLKWNYGAPAPHYPDQARPGRILSVSIQRGLYRPELE